MPTIAATPLLPSLLDKPVPGTVGEGSDTFAPVLTALLTTGASAPAVATSGPTAGLARPVPIVAADDPAGVPAAAPLDRPDRQPAAESTGRGLPDDGASLPLDLVVPREVVPVVAAATDVVAAALAATPQPVDGPAGAPLPEPTLPRRLTVKAVRPAPAEPRPPRFLTQPKRADLSAAGPNAGAADPAPGVPTPMAAPTIIPDEPLPQPAAAARPSEAAPPSSDALTPVEDVRPIGPRSTVSRAVRWEVATSPLAHAAAAVAFPRATSPEDAPTHEPAVPTPPSRDLPSVAFDPAISPASAQAGAGAPSPQGDIPSIAPAVAPSTVAPVTGVSATMPAASPRAAPSVDRVGGEATIATPTPPGSSTVPRATRAAPHAEQDAAPTERTFAPPRSLAPPASPMRDPAATPMVEEPASPAAVPARPMEADGTIAVLPSVMPPVASDPATQQPFPDASTAAVSVATPIAAPASDLRITPARPAPQPAVLPLTPAPAPSVAHARAVDAATPIATVPSMSPSSPVARAVDPSLADAPAAAPARADAPARQRAAEPTPVQPAILPALQAFGAALHRAATAERRQAAPLDQIAAPASIAAAPVVAAPPVAAEPAPVDTASTRWPEAMVARIEHLRDAANETSTRIRLHPDALGAVDVAVRREGEGVHVHFTAAEPATTRLLADAQPRLSELAEARGLKLTTGGEAGASLTGQGGQDRRQPAPELARTPRPAAPAPTTDPEADDRLA